MAQATVSDAPPFTVVQRRAPIGPYEINFAHQRRRQRVSWQAIAHMLGVNEISLREVAGEPGELVMPPSEPAPKRRKAVIAEPTRKRAILAGPARVLLAIAGGALTYDETMRRSRALRGTVEGAVCNLRAQGLLTGPAHRQFPRLTPAGRREVERLKKAHPAEAADV